MTDRLQTIRKFERAAAQRFTAAEFLVENAFHRDGMYLGGYVVECALKALILKWSPKTEFEETLEFLIGVGSKGHDFEYLKELLKRRRLGFPLIGVVDTMPSDQAILPREILRSLVRVASWNTSERYEVGNVRYNEAREFLTAAETIRAWAKRG